MWAPNHRRIRLSLRARSSRQRWLRWKHKRPQYRLRTRSRGKFGDSLLMSLSAQKYCLKARVRVSPYRISRRSKRWGFTPVATPNGESMRKCLPKRCMRTPNVYWPGQRLTKLRFNACIQMRRSSTSRACKPATCPTVKLMLPTYHVKPRDRPDLQVGGGHDYQAQLPGVGRRPCLGQRMGQRRSREEQISPSRSDTTWISACGQDEACSCTSTVCRCVARVANAIRK
ncbi:hypothetical protein ASR47_102530 [Janthinobacterium psychrotolerans]|uniref:Uncharacterized protein n=1 Tax=Janthinobacterium psychrotolerans TaxID=1747903 RepID=A0A1A7CA32_9BURK|nr:hypothetical protein ASR47_102530 [Janthinobacterium psychrotolerans]